MACTTSEFRFPISPGYNAESEIARLYDARKEQALSSVEATELFNQALAVVEAHSIDTILAKTTAVDFMMVLAKVITDGETKALAHPAAAKVFREALVNKSETFLRLEGRFKPHRELSRLMRSLREMVEQN